MATTISDIMAQALVYIEDERMSEELATNPALFYRRYSDYVEQAMTLLSTPPELYTHISEDHTKATYDDYYWKSTTESMSSTTTVATGKTGYDLCSVVRRTYDGTSVIYVPYTLATYDPTTGNVVFPIQEKADIEYQLDFYKDGTFRTLTQRQLRLFARAVCIIWNERLQNNWLNIQPKIKDSAFETVNEANYMAQLTTRTESVLQTFYSELRKYEQDVYYSNVVGEPNRIKELL